MRQAILRWQALEEKSCDATKQGAYYQAREEILTALQADPAPLSALEAKVAEDCLVACAQRLSRWQMERDAYAQSLERIRLQARSGRHRVAHHLHRVG